MTESEWLGCEEPAAMLRYLESDWQAERAPNARRKLRLFACGCCRRAWYLVEPYPEIRECVEFAERYADGDGAKKRLRKLVDECRHRYERYGERPGEDLAVAHVASAARVACSVVPKAAIISVCGSIGFAIGRESTADWPAQAALVRDIFGNPFQAVAVDPRWLTATVVALAETIYADRAFDRLPILADALEDAGCEDVDLLAHCRGPGPHVRGCWAVDLVLGKT